MLPAIAQDAAPATDVADGDGAITILDQSVPVAAEGPPEDDTIDPASGDDGLDDYERLLADFERFKELRGNNASDEAENLAKRMVESSIRLTGPTSSETAKTLINLAVMQQETADYEAAKQNFETAIEIIEDNEDQLNSDLINPLRGLGLAQLETGRPDLAVRTFGRAVHISHVNEGPHNLEQIVILESLAETNLRLGDLEQAKNNHDIIYSLNLRHFENNAIAMVPSLLRRAEWQRRTGYILDERATYRRVIRIVETENGKNDISLVSPLLKLGESYYYVDTSDSSGFPTATAASGELYFKRAVRIATEHPESDWAMVAKTQLALGDYYTFRADTSKARNRYTVVWDILSAEPDRLAIRAQTLETLTSLNVDPIPRYVGDATPSDRENPDITLLEGNILVSFDVNRRGRVEDLEIVEAEPAEFKRLLRAVQRQMRTRIYRPRFVDAEAVDTPDQVLSHAFYYLQKDLDQLLAELAAEAESK